ncbi:MAG: NAD(P)/FAD-dependent oxidoreductase [Verrucomicrobia bacterium]|nr:NAD(P)/FAD-dependent oxidoreductase [Verrucomicrobiota bacterium]
MRKHDFDIAVVGSGFGGSLIAMIAKKLGRSVILLERGKHPRFAIGESSTPLANLLLEELARRYELPALLPLAKWGSWQKAYPEVACGLKRGFTFYYHRWNQPFSTDFEHRNQLLVAASPRDEIADTHWYRADFDHFLVRQAQTAGVEYLDETELRAVSSDAGSLILAGRQRRHEFSIHAKFLIDATGPRGAMHRALALPELRFENLPATQGLFSHFRNVKRWDAIHASNEPPPYPVDDAALHHVFEGGWIWVLRFGNGITSAGVAVAEKLASDLNLSEGEPAWHRLLKRLPSVREQFAEAKPQFGFVHLPRLSFRSGTAAGHRWALLPSAAGFVDPLLSTGFALTLLGIRRLAQALDEDWEKERLARRLEAYSADTLDELEAGERLVAALYASMNDFAVFQTLAMLYFAAVSYAETARRLGRSELAESFLLHKRPVFGRELRQCCERVLNRSRNGSLTPAEKAALQDRIFAAIEPIDAAGLRDLSRRNWYPVKAEDLLSAADKFGVDTTAVRQLLTRNGFFGPTDEASGLAGGWPMGYA